MDVVRAVGMSAGTFYNYFKDKRELFEYISKENIEELRIRLRKLRKTDALDNVEERLALFYDTYCLFFDYIEQYPQQLLMLIRGGFGVDNDFDNSTWDFFSSFAHDFADDFQKWMDLGILKDINPVLFGHIIVGMCLHVGHSYIIEKNFTRDEAIHTLIDLNKAMFSMYLTEQGKTLLKDEFERVSPSR
jgi:AcrR family transcriptional regulator